MGKHKVVRVSDYYEISEGKIVRKKRICPRCGAFMADHRDRWSCGRCGYTEFKKG